MLGRLATHFVHFHFNFLRRYGPVRRKRSDWDGWSVQTYCATLHRTPARRGLIANNLTVRCLLLQYVKNYWDTYKVVRTACNYGNSLSTPQFLSHMYRSAQNPFMAQFHFMDLWATLDHKLVWARAALRAVSDFFKSRPSPWVRLGPCPAHRVGPRAWLVWSKWMGILLFVKKRPSCLGKVDSSNHKTH